jgi:hypothetical protein
VPIRLLVIIIMSLSKEQIDQLQTFNNLANRLIDTRFFKDTRDKSPSKAFNWTMNEQTDKLDNFRYTRDRIHDDEAIMAFVLLFRLFIQKDPTSIGEMAKLYDNLPIDPAYKTGFSDLRKYLNGYLDSLGRTTTPDDPTMRKILWTTIYGEYAHLDEAKREILKTWEKYQGDWDMIVGEFETTMYECAIRINQMKALNEEVLERYSPSPSPSSSVKS